MANWTFESTELGYSKMWDSIRIKSGADAVNANRFADKIIAGEDIYRKVEEAIGVPWFFVGALAMRESSCNMKCVLHNGEQIVGTRKKTRLVPKGLGPFATWYAAAIHALKLKKLQDLAWSPARFGFTSEIFNGLGYVGKGVNSAYLWAGSNHEQKGKYVRDHVWDKDFDDPQIGTMTVIKALEQKRPDIAEWIAANHTARMTTKTKIKIAVGSAAGAGATGAGVNEAVQESSTTMDSVMTVVGMIAMHGTLIATVFTIAAVLGSVGWHFYEKHQAKQEAEYV